MAKPNRRQERENRIKDAVELLKQAVSLVDDVKEDCLDAFGNLPENFQQGERGQILEEAASALEEVSGGIDDQIASLEEVEF